MAPATINHMRHTLAPVIIAIAACLPTLARADQPTYDVKKDEAKATVGVKARTGVTIAARPGWHVNEEAPLTMKLTPGPGITVDKTRLTRADLAQQSKEMARFEVAFTPSEPGKKTIDAEARFVMCQATTCMPVTEKIALAVEVAAPKKK
jgi:DsbC/DsbD-like thiol-disulfide interchange protein